MLAGVRLFLLHSACVFLVFGADAGQNIYNIEPAHQNHNDDIRNDNVNYPVPYDTERENYVYRDPNPGRNEWITDEDIQDDNDLGLKHEKERWPISDEDIKDDNDLGLKPQREKEPISDEDIKDDNDLGLKPLKEKELISDKDIKDDLDLGLKHEKIEEPILHADIEDDLELGVRPETTSEPISYTDIENDVNLGINHKNNFKANQSKPATEADKKLPVDIRRERKQHQIESRKKHLRTDTKEPITDNNSVFVELKTERNQSESNANITRKESNSSHPFTLSQTRRSILSIYNRQENLDFLSKQFNEIKQQKPDLEDDNDNICHRYDVDGCSIPLGLPFFFKELFTNSCYRHDICYGCGVKYGFNRKACDYVFKDSMWNACVAKYNYGRYTIVDPRKGMIVKAVERLHDQFNEILRQEMNPLMTPTDDNKEKDIERFQNHARLIQGKVLKQWVELLRKHLFYKKTFSKGERVVGFEYDKRSFQENKGSQSDVRYENNLTTSLCEHILNYGGNSKMVELTCDEIELLSCHFFDYVYFLGVRIFAESFYHDSPEFYCEEPFVRKCLPHGH